jgi:hypothetical protein
LGKEIKVLSQSIIWTGRISIEAPKKMAVSIRDDFIIPLYLKAV